MNKVILTIIFMSAWSLTFSQTRDVFAQIEQNEYIAEKVVNQQLEAYNNRNIEEFLSAFSDSVEVYAFPNKLRFKGKDKMRRSYMGMFENLTDLNCKITNRMVHGNTVIDSEEISGIQPNQLLKAVVIYTINEGKIQKVYFVSQLD